ncbi:MAG TPA: BPSL0067 family protein [Acetobacteraceae bacterium]|nr:BPSL0067 family protein [Acetobacteraceae bacterium]
MIRAVQQHGRTQQTRSRSRQDGTTFTVPVLPDGAIATQASASPAAVGSAPSAAPAAAKGVGSGAAGSAAVPASMQRFVGRSIGTGQCVALAKAVQPSLGATCNWKCGEKVQGNTTIEPGTVIATFNRASRYANATDGSSHAAIYLGQSAAGLQVLDQWAGSRAAVRTIPWNNGSGVAANSGSAFHVVKTG